MPKNAVEFIPGRELKFCLHCGSPRVKESDREIKCLDCGMGKLKGFATRVANVSFHRVKP